MDIRKNHGQALIIIVMIIALVLTVIAASSYQLTSQTQGSKLQEESVRALAAADAGIEVGLKLANTVGSQTFSFDSSQVALTLPGVDAARSEIIITDSSSTQFSTPLILKDDQFTFYANNYPTFDGTPFSGRLRVYFASETPLSCSGARTMPALEMTVTYDDGNAVRRRLIEPCTSGTTLGASSYGVTSRVQTIDGVRYTYFVDNINVGSEFPRARTIIVRPLFGNTHVAFEARSGSFGTQGKIIESRAYSISGASKIVSVFQSLPQIPSELFVTSF